MNNRILQNDEAYPVVRCPLKNHLVNDTITVPIHYSEYIQMA